MKKPKEMTAEIKIFDDNGYIYVAENVHITDLEMEMIPLSAGVVDGYQHYRSGLKYIHLSGRITDYIDRRRNLNKKVLIL